MAFVGRPEGYDSFMGRNSRQLSPLLAGTQSAFRLPARAWAVRGRVRA